MNERVIVRQDKYIAIRVLKNEYMCVILVLCNEARCLNILDHQYTEEYIK